MGPVVCLILVTVAIGGAGCSGPGLPRPERGACAKPDVWHWAALASASLRIERFVVRPLYDVDGHGGARKIPPMTCNDCTAVVSYPQPMRHRGGPKGFARLRNRSFTYDNALVALVRLSEGRIDESRQVLNTLVALQRADGAWGFSFNIHGDGFYNAGYVRSGVVAWVLYAMARYTEITHDRRFVPAMRRSGAWLLAHLDGVNGLIRGGQGRWLNGGARFEPTHIPLWASTEHNVDAWFASRLAAHVDPAGAWPDVSALGSAIARRLWMPREGRYARGISGFQRDPVAALDAAGTWSALYAIASGRPKRAVAALAYVEDELGFQRRGWRVYRPDNERRTPLWFVEGSVAQAMGLARLGQPRRAAAAMTQLAQWACVRGVPLAYSDRWATDFPLTPAAAPTAWFILAAREVSHGETPFLWRRSLP